MAEVKEHPILTRAKLTQMVRHALKSDNVEMVECDVGLAAPKGEGYSSEVNKLDMTVKVGDKGALQELHWMCKTIPAESFMPKEAMRALHMEDKEIGLYTKIIPAWKKIIEERGADITLNFGDICFTEFFPDPEEGSIIAMQNLNTLGYRAAINKKKGLSPKHVRLALDEMAKYHALGYAWMKNYPGGIEQALKDEEVLLRDYCWSDQEAAAKEVFGAWEAEGPKQYMKLLENIQEDGQDLAGALRKFHEEHDLVKHQKDLIKGRAGEFRTMLHGDFWFNNMLFKYGADGETPISCALIDLAINFYGNPANDLIYFFYMSTTPMLRKTHLEHFLGYYHDQFVTCLHKLGEDPTVYPYRTLLKDYNHRLLSGFVFAMQALPAVLAKKEDAIGVEDLSLAQFGDLPKEELEALRTKKTEELFLKALKNEPQIKLVLGGCMMEMIEAGILQVEI